MHYNPTGQPEKDRSRLGIWFAKGPVTHEVLNLQAGDPVPGSGGRGLYFAQGKEILYESDDTTGRRGKTPPIPPHTESFKMMGITPVNEPITLYALTPHMHLRGRSMKWWVTYPDGREEMILNVPNYDFNWQIQYELETPLKVPAGSKITNVAIYDNSVKNKWNPVAREGSLLVGAELGRDVPADDAVLGRQPRSHEAPIGTPRSGSSSLNRAEAKGRRRLSKRKAVDA